MIVAHIRPRLYDVARVGPRTFGIWQCPSADFGALAVANLCSDARERGRLLMKHHWQRFAILYSDDRLTHQ